METFEKQIDKMITEVDQTRLFDTSKALKIAVDARHLCKEKNYKKGEAILLNKMGSLYYITSEYPNAIDCVLEALPILESFGLDYQLAIAYNNLGNVFFDLANYETSFSYYNKQNIIAQKNNYTDRFAVGYNNIGEVYKYLHENDLAIEYYSKSIHEDRKVDFVGGKGINYLNLAEIYATNNEYYRALDVLAVGVDLLNKFNFSVQIGEAYRIYAVIYWKLNEIDKAHHYFEMALEHATLKNVPYLKIDILISYLDFLQDQNETSLVQRNLEDAYGLSLSNKLYEKLIVICKFAGSFYEQQGDSKRSLDFYKNYVVYNQKVEEQRRTQIKEGIVLIRKTEEFKQEAEIDQLTGLANRRKYQNYFSEHWDKLKKLNQPISLLFFDIDYFKEYNDHYGHIEGDKCLIRVSNTLDAYVGKKGLTVRYGGDEFIGVLPLLQEQQAHELAHSIQTAISNQNITHGYSKIADHITVSIGLSSIVPTDGLTFEHLAKQADDALYEAKNRGRNQIVIKTFTT